MGCQAFALLQAITFTEMCVSRFFHSLLLELLTSLLAFLLLPFHPPHSGRIYASYPSQRQRHRNAAWDSLCSQFHLAWKCCWASLMHLITPHSHISHWEISLSPDPWSSAHCSRKETFLLKRDCVKRIGLQIRFLHGGKFIWESQKENNPKY